MTDVIQRYLEEMVPELEDLEERSIISKYEDNLDRLIKERRGRTEFKRGELKKTSRGDYSGQQRVCKIYERAINRFHGDVKLWLQYADYLKKKDSTRLLSRTIARALQLHPTKPSLWIYAAAWEFEENGSIVAARAMMQRGLRFNGNSKELWIEYFRLELAYIEMIDKDDWYLNVSTVADQPRQDKTDNVDSKAEFDKDMLELDIDEPKEPVSQQHQEMIAKTTEAAKQPSDLVDSLSEGTIAKIVYQFAIKEIPSDLQFRKQFLDVYAHFSGHEAGRNQIYESIANEFSDSVEAHALLAERHLNGVLPDTVAFVEGLRKAVEEYKTAIQTIQNGEIREHHCSFLAKQLRITSEENIRKYLVGSMKEAFEQAHQNSQATADVYLQWARFTKSTLEDTDNALQILVLATSQYPEQESLWLEQLALLSDKQRLANYQAALSQCASSVPLWQGLIETIETLWRNDEINEDQAEQEYMDAVLHATAQSGHIKMTSQLVAEEICSLVQTHFVNWTFKRQGLKEVRRIADRIIHAVPATKLLFERCIQIEQNEATSATDRTANQRIDWLFDRMVQADNTSEGMSLNDTD
ncbi:hypothetical protein BDF19DRAFT_447127 [Syncephalis fuscata]|nr:hypothetical protein BDF19DRAFT_447127 [Syncephalis fuscata]